jgi:ribosomal protein S18 acetylase RimI-like enzyme
MQVSIEDISRENLCEIPDPCRTCLYWEDPAIGQCGKELSEAERIQRGARKAAWFQETLKEFGSCGKILYANTKPVGYAQYSTSARLPNVQAYRVKGLGTEQEGVAFISCLYISDKKFRGRGLGRRVLDHVIADLRQRGLKAVETIARRGSTNNPSGPIELFLGEGFRIREEINSDYALVRLDLLSQLASGEVK